MKHSIKLLTPRFALLIDAFVTSILRQEAYSEIEEESVILFLTNYWDGHRGHLPEDFEIPEELRIPEFVMYIFDSSEVGQPLMASMVPSSFTPPNLSTDKFIALKNYLESTHPAKSGESINEHFILEGEPEEAEPNEHTE